MQKLFLGPLTVILLSLIIVGTLRATDIAPADQPQQLEFFETKIRPALVEYCFECHSAETEASGGLLLDSKGGWMAGGDSGDSIVPGKSAESRLIRAISYADPDLQMPPEGKLPADVIAAFEAWIDAGAVDPRQADGQAMPQRQTGLPVERAEEHWAYRPLTTGLNAAGGPLAASGRATDSSTIDLFINHALAAQGISAADGSVAPRATREVLARRLYFDLTGLPPTPDELSTFLDDGSDLAYERLVDRLLASPRYGETFARRWMDVVRYADSITLRGFVLPQAWRYRDYLVEAFAEDRSFTAMVQEQMAGDLMSADSQTQRRQQLVATAFWALGNTNLEQQDKTQLEMDYIDEQLEVMGRAFLAQTIGCARCHDHKFDPIPTKDYYALAGIMRSSVALEHDNVSKWIEQPLPLPPEEQQALDALSSQRSGLAKQVANFKKQLSGIAGEDKRFIPVQELAGIVVDSADAKLVGEWTVSSHTGRIVGDSYIHDGNELKGLKTATLEPKNLPPGEYQLRLAYTAADNRTSHLPVRVFSADGEATVIVNQQKPTTEDGLWVSLGNYRFEENGQAFVLISNADTRGHVIVDAVQFLPRDAAPQPLVQVEDQNRLAEQQQLTADLKRAEQQLKELDGQLAAQPRYLTIIEKNPATDIPIHIRGDVHNLGDVVPRGFLTAFKPTVPKLHADAVGRLELAKWVSSPENPLTARVYANRVWSWLMGQGLVASVNNFGTTGTRPSHPELLDWLAGRLQAHGWSTKSLVRDIVLSDAYQRAIIEAPPQLRDIDPDNRLYWRGHTRRVTVESLRDSMLMVSGELDLEMGGSLIRPGTSADYNYPHQSTRRSLYQPVFRNSLPELFEAFDFADTSVSTGQRPRSTVAPQALVLMNHPWVTARARQTAQRFLQSAQLGGAEELVQQLYLECFSRQPTSAELEYCANYLNAAADQSLAAGHSETPEQDAERLQQLVQTLFASLDFRYLE